jgi:hypothetical protein
MKYYFYAVVFLLGLASPAFAQDFFTVGLQGKYTTNTRDFNVPEVYADLGQKFFEFKDTNLQYRLYGSYSEKPDIADMFTRDNNPVRIASAQVIVRPSVRWNLNGSYFRPHFSVGVDYTRHFGLPSAPNQALNPVVGFGTRIGRTIDVEVARVFADRLYSGGFPIQTVGGVITARRESPKSKGWRFTGEKEFRIRGAAHVVIGGEYSDIVYRACGNLACDAYREYDGIGKIFVGFRIHRGY